MKPKKFSKNLVLNKKTIVNLTDNMMDEVKGGKPPTMYTYCLYSCTGEPCTTYEKETCGCYTLNPRCP